MSEEFNKQEVKLPSKEKKVRKQKSPEEIAAIKECRARKSYRGNIYGHSFPGDWRHYDPVGWVYMPEEFYSFEQQYVQSTLSKKYVEREGCVDIEILKDNPKEGEERAYMGTAHTDEIKDTHVKCAFTSNWVDKEKSFKFTHENGKVVCVSDYARRKYLFKCDFDGKLYHSSNRVSIRGSEKYKVVSSANVKGNFAQCKACGNMFEAAEVKPREELSSHTCNSCYEKHLYKNVILQHDAKDYPAPIHSEVERYGHVVKNGMVFATNKKEKVKIIRLFGVEVETEIKASLAKKEGVNRRKIAYEIKKCLGTDFVIMKEDGTLTMNGKYSDGPGTNGDTYAGFEIVTAPADRKTQEERWHRLTNSLYYPMLRAWDTDTCGFHVHVTRAALTELQIGRMLRFINHPNNKKFVELVAGRSEKKFTKYVPKDVSDVLHPEKVVNPDESKARDRARRVALNLSNEKTVEFRIFRGTVNPKHIARNIQFCDAVCDFCLPCSRSMVELCHPSYFRDFIKLNMRHYPQLAEWMILHKLIEFKKIGDKADMANVKINPANVEEGEDKTDGGLAGLSDHAIPDPIVKKDIAEVKPSPWGGDLDSIWTTKPIHYEYAILKPGFKSSKKKTTAEMAAEVNTFMAMGAGTVAIPTPADPSLQPLSTPPPAPQPAAQQPESDNF